MMAKKKTGTALVASSALERIDSGGVWYNPRRQESWQREMWRLLEVTGEAHYAATIIGSAMSRCRLYMADVVDGKVVGETKNKKASAIGNSLFGGEDRKTEEMFILGFNMFAVGEALLFGKAGDRKTKDEWSILSINDVRREGGNVITDMGHGKVIIRPGVDILHRVWVPHPEKRKSADSPMRSTRIVLRELEELTKFIFAQINSRLLTGGILPWPSGTTPMGAESTVADDITAQLMKVVAKASSGNGTAEFTAPIIVEVPPESLGKIGLIPFSTELSKQALELRAEAVRRFARGIDLPAEKLLGMGDANHWSAWQIDQSGVDTHITPSMSRVCRAFQEAWIGPALQRAGLDPEKFTLWFDTSPLTTRPQRLQDTLDLYTQGLVSAQAVLDAGAYLDGDAPKPEEDIKRWIRTLIERDPNLFNQASIRVLAGITEEMMPATQALTDMAGTPAPPPPTPATVPGKHVLPTVPDTAPSLSASSFSKPITLALADAMSVRTLELAGGRLLTRDNRGMMRDIPRSELHTRVKVDPEKVPALVSGAGTGYQEMVSRHGLEHPEELCSAVAEYCGLTLQSSTAHSMGRLEEFLLLKGVIDA
jgi:hypothetical protein